MQDLAQKTQIPFYAHIVAGGTHFSILQPLNRMLAQKMLSDEGATCSISISEEDVARAFAQGN